MNRWRLLLTRSEPDCQLQVNYLASLNITAISLPLIEIVPIPETDLQRSQLLDFDRYTTLIVTSKPAAKLILERLDYYWPQLPIQQAWFSVGKATADILKTAGLDACYPDPSEGDDSEALWASAQFQESLADPHCRTLIIKGQKGRPWLQEKLALSGIPTDTIELYYRKVPHYSADFIVDTITQHNLNALVLSSGEALENLRHLSGDAWQKIAYLTYFVPSARIAKQAEELNIKHIINCHGASQSALMNALKSHQPHNLL